MDGNTKQSDASDSISFLPLKLYFEKSNAPGSAIKIDNKAENSDCFIVNDRIL